MVRKTFIKNSISLIVGATLAKTTFAKCIAQVNVTKKIFISGGNYDLAWFKQLIALTGKLKPKVCFLPTASGDEQAYINYWLSEVKDLSIEPYVQKVFISSADQASSFEDILLGMDAIIVGGGNTLNMIALWKAQGIDIVLRKAWERGIVLSGSSAGTVCWFEQALVDSRPQNLSTINCLGFLKGSCCVHYHSDMQRVALLKHYIKNGTIKSGFALDDNAGLYFENEKLVKVIAFDDKSKAYRLDLTNNEVMEKTLLPNAIY